MLPAVLSVPELLFVDENYELALVRRDDILAVANISDRPVLVGMEKDANLILTSEEWVSVKAGEAFCVQASNGSRHFVWSPQHMFRINEWIVRAIQTGRTTSVKLD